MPAPPRQINSSLIIQSEEKRAAADKGFVIIVEIFWEARQQFRQEAALAAHPLDEGLRIVKIGQRRLRHSRSPGLSDTHT